MNILMIDDDYLDLEGMQVLLKQLPLDISNVYTALNARTARETVQNKNIHIILCDVEMPEETGLEFARWLNQEGIMIRGTLVRHLILPSLTGESMKLLTWIRDSLPEGTPVSLMRQYIPCNNVQIPGLDRTITEKEYARVRDHMLALGIPGFLQEPEAADPDFVPLFNEDASFV